MDCVKYMTELVKDYFKIIKLLYTYATTKGFTKIICVAILYTNQITVATFTQSGSSIQTEMATLTNSGSSNYTLRQ